MRTRHFLIAAGIVVLLGSLLAADLHFRGLAWRVLYNQTGEEDALGQIRGLAELMGNLIRPPLNTQPAVPVAHTDNVPYGVNVFLQKEVEEPKIRAMLTMIRDAGFVWLRQEFPWEDLEVDGRGQFTDTRNDLNGDGVPDTQNAWLKYDRMVDLTEAYGLQMMVRLSNPPDWAIADHPDKGTFAPPDDLQDYVNYAVAVAERYKGRIHVYQVWNEPNIYPEWGEAFADPVAYTDMLCRTYRALKQVDPTLIVVSAAIAPTISLDGYLGYQDIVYLQNMYDAGVQGCFDVLAAQGYGLFSGALDRRLRATSVNVARHTYYRDIMVTHGDADKPIWITEAAWNAVLDAPLPPDQIVQYDRYGLATQAQAARYTPELYQRAQQEWPWVGVIFYWFFTRPDPFEAGQAFYYFRMAEPDYSPDKPTFTPLPVYDSMKAYITGQVPTLYRGVHQAESWQVNSQHTLIADERAGFGQALRDRTISFTVEGTGLRLRYRSAAAITVSLGATTSTLPATVGWSEVTLFDQLLPATQPVTLSVSTGTFDVDSLTILNQWERLATLVVLAGAGVGMALLVLAYAAWTRWQFRRERHA